MSRMPIFTFHSIDASGSPVSYDPVRFSRLMQSMAARGRRGKTVSHALDTLRAGGSVDALSWRRRSAPSLGSSVSAPTHHTRSSSRT